MVESGHSNGDGRLDIARLRRAGYPQEQIDEMVVATLTKPEDLITLEQAADEFGIPLGRVSNWVDRGHIEVKAREKFHSRGGGKRLIDRYDVAYLVENPPKMGRPRKNGGEPIVR